MHPEDRALALLDHRFLTRVGNLRTLISVAGVIGLLAVAVVLAVIKLYADVGWVPLLFVGLALVIVLVLALGRLRARSPGPGGQLQVPNGKVPTRTAGEPDDTSAALLGELLREQMDEVASAAVAKARTSPERGQVQRGGPGSTNLQAGRDIRVDEGRPRG